MHSTVALFSKALRFPLTSKRGNKDFYKGTRAGNILRRKRLGAVSRLGEVLKSVTPTGRVVDRVEYRRVMKIDETKVPSFIVPPGLAETTLKAFVRATKAPESAVGTPLPPSSYYSPTHDPKTSTARQKSLVEATTELFKGQRTDVTIGPARVQWGQKGLSPDVYMDLKKHLWNRRIVGGSEDIERAIRDAQKAKVKSGA